MKLNWKVVFKIKFLHMLIFPKCFCFSRTTKNKKKEMLYSWLRINSRCLLSWNFVRQYRKVDWGLLIGAKTEYRNLFENYIWLHIKSSSSLNLGILLCGGRHCLILFVSHEYNVWVMYKTNDQWLKFLVVVFCNI